MWCEKSGDKVRYCERYMDPLTGKRRKVSITFPKDSPANKREALRLLDAKIQSSGSSSAVFLPDLLELYLSSVAVKDSTAIIYRATVAAFIRDTGCSMEISRFSPLLVRRWLNSSPASLKAKNRQIKLLRFLFKWAYDFGLVPSDPMRGVQYFKTDEVRDVSQLYLEPEELRDVLHQLERIPACYYFCKLQALSGLRAGEVSALLVSDIDGDYIHVTKAYSSNSRLVTAPKSSASVRDVYIQTELREFLSDLLAWRREYVFAHGFRNDILIPSVNGVMYTQTNVNKCLSKLVCSKPLHSHIFRHTHASILAAAGVPLESISRRLGHGDSKITREIYVHQTEKAKQKEEAALRKVKIL